MSMEELCFNAKDSQAYLLFFFSISYFPARVLGEIFKITMKLFISFTHPPYDCVRTGKSYIFQRKLPPFQDGIINEIHRDSETLTALTKEVPVLYVGLGSYHPICNPYVISSWLSLMPSYFIWGIVLFSWGVLFCCFGLDFRRVWGGGEKGEQISEMMQVAKNFCQQ